VLSAAALARDNLTCFHVCPADQTFQAIFSLNISNDVISAKNVPCEGGWRLDFAVENLPKTPIFTQMPNFPPNQYTNNFQTGTDGQKVQLNHP
jgi:hypothetical protein